MAKKKMSKAERARLRRGRAAAKAHLKKVTATHKKLEMELKKMKKVLRNPEPWWFGP